MKTSASILIVGTIAAGAILYFVFRSNKTGSTSGGSTTIVLGSPDVPQHMQSRDIFESQQPPTDTSKTQNAETTSNALAAGKTVPTGIEEPTTTGIPQSYNIDFLRDQPNPLDGSTQRVFQLKTKPVTPDYARGLTDRGAFIEVLPIGVASTAPNVVQTSDELSRGHRQTSGGKANPTTDPKVADAVRKYIAERTQKKTTPEKPSTTASATIQLGSISIQRAADLFRRAN